jgi:transposase
MIAIGPATRIYLCAGATDMRKGFEGLCGLARHRLEGDPLSGHLFVFCNRRRTRIKILYWDGSGMCIWTKRLEKGTFHWPQHTEDSARVHLSAEELSLLLGGIELEATRYRKWWRWAA